MCVFILASVRKNPIHEFGMDIFVEKEDEIKDIDYFTKNCGSGKRYPGGPVCAFQGGVVLFLTQWIPKGLVTSQILVNILATLDYIRVFDCLSGRNPFLLLDDHYSRFKLPFLRYIVNKVHMWVICASVPYRTSLW